MQDPTASKQNKAFDVVCSLETRESLSMGAIMSAACCLIRFESGEKDWVEWKRGVYMVFPKLPTCRLLLEDLVDGSKMRSGSAWCGNVENRGVEREMHVRRRMSHS